MSVADWLKHPNALPLGPRRRVHHGRPTLPLQIVDAVIQTVRDAGHDLMLNNGNLYLRSKAGTWHFATPGDRQWLKVCIQAEAEALGEAARLGIIRAAWRRLIEDPRLFVHEFDWKKDEEPVRTAAAAAADGPVVRRSIARVAILEALTNAAGTIGPKQIAKICGMRSANVRFHLKRLLDIGVVEKVAYGRYRRPKNESTAASASPSPCTGVWPLEGG